MRWEHFPHEADIGVRGFGATPAEAFEQAALALTAAVTYLARTVNCCVSALVGGGPFLLPKKFRSTSTAA